MKIDRIDHLVLTVADLDATINLHEAGKEFLPYAAAPTFGSADLCLIATVPVDTVAEELVQAGIPIEEGPVERTGATGVIRSVYLRDPDGNLIELSEYL